LKTRKKKKGSERLTIPTLPCTLVGSGRKSSGGDAARGQKSRLYDESKKTKGGGREERKIEQILLAGRGYKLRRPKGK